MFYHQNVESLNIFSSPLETLRRLNIRPVWLLALLLTGLIKFIVLITLYKPSYEPVKLLLSFVLEFIPLLVKIFGGSLLLYLFVFGLGGKTNFIKVFSLLTHIFLLIEAVYSALAIIIYLVNPSVDKQNIVITNLGFLVSAEKSPVLNYLLSVFDIFTLGYFFLIIIGLHYISQTLPLKRIIWGIFFVWFIYFVIVLGIKIAVS